MRPLHDGRPLAYELRFGELAVASIRSGAEGFNTFAVALAHPALVDLLQKAYSAEKAAAFAYIGHAGSLKDPVVKAAINQIERDEWGHRAHVLTIMRQYDIPVSRSYEMKYGVIGKVIAGSCHVIGWFMPIFFAGKLESGNVCEYFVMMHHFHSLGIREHDAILCEMGIKEKEHEVYFLDQINGSRLLPFFERVFAWGVKRSLNDVSLEEKYAVSDSHRYCTTYKAGGVKAAVETERQPG